MRRALAALLITAIILSFAPTVSAAGAAEDFDGYLVRLSAPVGEGEAERVGCEALGGALYYAADPGAVSALASLGEIESCEKNYGMETRDIFEDYEPSEWNLISVEAAAAWEHINDAGERDRTGSGVTVAIVDSGVMADHPDLVNANVLDYIALSSEEDGIDNYHGK